MGEKEDTDQATARTDVHAARRNTTFIICSFAFIDSLLREFSVQFRPLQSLTGINALHLICSKSIQRICLIHDHCDTILGDQQ